LFETQIFSEKKKKKKKDLIRSNLVSSANHTSVKDVVKPYDWTYTTAYRGTTATELEQHQGESLVDTERLKRQEPILFYDENILYEDELADNGTAMLTIRLVTISKVYIKRETYDIYYRG
jgi:type 2A phosphatase activator TIP41